MSSGINNPAAAVRAQAIQAASTVAVAVGMSEPGLVLRVAHMMEVYILRGDQAAQQVIDSWNNPDEREPLVDGPGSTKAQVLANQAREAVHIDVLDQLKSEASKGNLNEEIVTIDGASGSLWGYLEHRSTEVSPRQVSSSRADLGL